MHFLLYLFLFFALSISSYAKELKIITTIKPLHSIISQVAGKAQQVDLILAKNNSPHHFHLTPSIARKMYHANLIFIIDQQLETFMHKYLSSIPEHQKFYEAAKFAGIKLLPLNEKIIWKAEIEKSIIPKRGPQPEDDHEHVHHHHENESDLHIWLDVDNTIIIANNIAKILAEADPENKSIYHGNAKTFAKKLLLADKKIKNQLEKTTKQFLVFHDAYQYFTKRYNLKPAGAIVLNPNSTPTVKSVAELKKLVAEQKIACIFREPQFSPKIVDFLQQNTQVKTGLLDAEWGDDNLTSGPHFIKLLTDLADSFRSCL